MDSANYGASGHSAHQSQLASRIDPNMDPSSYSTTTGPGTAVTTDTQDHHHGRDATIAGTGAATAGAYMASTRNDGATRDTSSSSMPGSSDTRASGLGATSASSSSQAAAAKAAAGSAASRPVDDLKLKDMPGAYPETPLTEADKTLGSDAAGVGSGAAVIAAQRAYQKHTPEQETSTKATPTTVKPATTVAPVVVPGISSSRDEPSLPQGTLGEKIQDAQAREGEGRADPAFVGCHGGGRPGSRCRHSKGSRGRKG